MFTKNTKKYITFLAAIEKEVIRIDKKVETVSHRIQFIDSARFMASSLSNLVYNVFEGIHKIKCKHCKNCSLEYTNVKYGLIEFKCLCCN